MIIKNEMFSQIVHIFGPLKDSLNSTLSMPRDQNVMGENLSIPQNHA
jgi:hypothetical protein